MKKIALMIACCVLFVAGGAQATIITNGSFEVGPVTPGGYATLAGGSQAITGWTTGGSLDYIGSYWRAADGKHSLDMDGYYATGSISQTFTTVIGQGYLVKFALAGNPDGQPVVKELHASVTSGLSYTDGFFLFNDTGATHDSMGWMDQSFAFIAGDTLTTLRFESLDTGGAFGPALDNVRVDPVPEPGTLMLLGAGLFGLAIYGKRRKNS